jgi:microcin C transport system substrate-binding protein
VVGRKSMGGLSRRDFMVIGAGIVASGPSALTATAQAAGGVESHGMSAFGDLGYPAIFAHLKYVNPTAPKGGVFSQLAGAGTATFNSLNGFILKGDAAQDMELVFASLMARANDEPDAIYGLAAEKVEISTDRRTYRFKLRDGIKCLASSSATRASEYRPSASTKTT